MNSFTKLISFLIVLFVSQWVYSVHYAAAERDYNQRGYIYDILENERGFRAVIGRVYTLSSNDSRFPQQITIDMSVDRSLMIRIEPDRFSANVLMLASEVAAPAVLKAVWAHDDLRYPVTFWTETYWVPETMCHSTGCPKMRFKAMKGTIGIEILKKRK